MKTNIKSAILKILPILLIGVQTIFAQDTIPHISVLEIIIPDATEENAEEAELTMRETKFLTDELRRQAAVVLQNTYSVYTREQILSMLPESEEEMEKLKTAIEIGKFFKSPFATNSFIGKLSNLFTLKVELYETETGNLIGDFTGESQDLKGLVDVIRLNAPTLFKKLVKEEEVKVPEPVKVTVEVQSVPTNIPAEPKTKVSTWVAIGFDILGVSAIGIGIYQHTKATNHYQDYEKFKRPTKMEYEYNPAKYDIPIDAKYKEVKDAKSAREAAFISGGVLLLSGVAVHVLF